MISETQ